MSDNVIIVSGKTAQAFLPTDSPENVQIDLSALATIAKTAMENSDRSLQAAQEIAGGNWWDRFFNSGDMQKHVIQSITHIRDISKVNLGLSAICNDLAAANLEHASRIDKNHHATNQQLNQVQQLTADLLAHLRQPREPGLLDRLLPGLSKANPADQDAMRGWLRTLTEEIDLQYVVLQENLDQLSQQNDNTVESVARFRVEIASLGESLTSQKADAIQQLGVLFNRLTAFESEFDQKAEKTVIAIRQSHEALSDRLEKQVRYLTTDLHNDLSRVEDKVLSNETAARLADTELEKKISGLTREMTKRYADTVSSLQTERDTREVMQKALVKFIKQNEESIRKTIGELNKHLLKRMLWGAGGIVVLQVLGFGFLAFKMGLFK